MSKMNLLTMQAFASVLIFLLSACAEEPLNGNDQTGKGHTVTLHLAATVAPIPETKATVIPARSGSEAEAAGFYYEMVSSDAETGTGTPGFGIEVIPAEEDSSEINFSSKKLVSKALTTRAPSVLKNTYALLFTSTGAFNGRAQIGTYTVGTPQDITFTNVANPKADGCRLLIVANDDLAVSNYASSKGTGDFAGFTGTYADFQKLTITSAVNQDADVPYAGSATVNLSQSETGETVEAPLFWTLAKITLDNKLFQIEGGPARSNITLYNGGERRFATPAADNYEGTGNTQTTTFIPSIDGGNKDVTTWYVGENIRPAGSSISSAADRNRRKAPANACYIEIKSASIAVPKNTSPAIGEEYIPQGGSRAFTYIIYLGKSADVSDFSLRRHTKYGLTLEIGGTLAAQEQLAAEDGRVAFSGGGGLAIGRFGGPADYTTGNGYSHTVKGTYEKMLLLEPNTSRTTATDNVRKTWGTTGTQYQKETRRYWDRTYIYGITADGTVGGMGKDVNSVYTYCNELTLGDVPKGTWYVPTQAQFTAISTTCGGLEGGRYADYTGWSADNYWISTEIGRDSAWYECPPLTCLWCQSKAINNFVRCVRDCPVPGATSSNQYITEIGGYPVIDLSELSPLGCLLNSAEATARCQEMNSQTASNTDFLQVGIGVSGINGRWNTKMSSRFQIMKTDLLTADWASAYEACKKYGGEGGESGQWHLPTIRELAMVRVLHPQLLKGGLAEFLSYSYHCSTESPNPIENYQINFDSGNMGYYVQHKTHELHVRCIRDIQ